MKNEGIMKKGKRILSIAITSAAFLLIICAACLAMLELAADAVRLPAGGQGSISPGREGLSSYLAEKRQKDFDEGRTSMGADTEEILDEEADSEDNPMCQDLYGKDGTLLWRGLGKDQAENASKEAIDKFCEAYGEHCEEAEEVTQDTPLPADDSGTPRDRLMLLCAQYDRRIPYGAGGYSYYSGYFKAEGKDNEYHGQNSSGGGLCGLGYAIWAYRNALGKTPSALRDKRADTGRMYRISPEGLQPGDFCIAHDEAGTRYGIVTGEYGGRHVVAICDSTPLQGFPAGASHFAYIEDETDECLGECFPVPFQEYYRLKEMED